MDQSQDINKKSEERALWTQAYLAAFHKGAEGMAYGDRVDQGVAAADKAVTAMRASIS